MLLLSDFCTLTFAFWIKDGAPVWLDAWAQRPLPAEFGVNFSFYDSGSFGILWQSRLGLELGVRISESH